jgi:adenylyl- and sulfurtransferase ThiI/cysteine sulfinate desulfinase/cysteine desulfurase-like protein
MISSIEHSSIGKYIMHLLNSKGYNIVIIPVNKNGIVNLETFTEQVSLHKDKLLLVSCMFVNNEIGTIQPILEMVKIVKSQRDDNIIFHSDISGNIGEFYNLTKLSDNVLPNIVSFSAYKFGGPHYGLILSSTKLTPKYYGTPDVKNILATTNALQLYLAEYDVLNTANNVFKNNLKSILFNSFESNNIEYIDLDTILTTSNILAFLLPGLKASYVQQKLSDNLIAIGSGSACTTNEGSTTVRAMGYSESVSQELIRLSFNSKDYQVDKHNEICQRVATLFVDTIKSSLFLVKKHRVQIIKPGVKLITSSIRERPNFTGRLDTPVDIVMIDTIGLTFAELSLKGSNFEWFLTKLKNNIIKKFAFLKNVLDLDIQFTIARQSKNIINIKLSQSLDTNDKKLTTILKHLTIIPGIATVIPMVTLKHTDLVENICYQVANLYENERKSYDVKTFKVSTTITDGKYLNNGSTWWSGYIGNFITKRYSDHVDLSNPNITLSLYCDGKTLYSYTQKLQGIGGLPIYTEGTIIFLVTRLNYYRSIYSIYHMVKRGSEPIVIIDNCPEIYDELKLFVDTLISGNSKVLSFVDSITKLEEVIETSNSKHLVIEFGIDENNLLFSSFLDALKTIGNKLNLNCFGVTTLISDDDIQKFITGLKNKFSFKFTKLETDLSTNMYCYLTLLSGIESMPPFNNSGLVLISGGIDSPVVSTKLKANNIYYQYVNFISKLDDIVSKQKIINIIKQIQQGNNCLIKVYFVEFGGLQEIIAKNYKEHYRVMLYKIFMVVIANNIAIKNKLSFIAMGNSWGQVASQTPDNLHVTDYFSQLPIFCPLISENKSDIIINATTSNTFDKSICNGNDCCTAFLPKNPILSANKDYIKGVLDEIDYTKYISIENIEI